MPVRPICALATCLLVGEARAAAAPQLDELVVEVRELASSDNLEDAGRLLEMLERGLPPPALVAFLTVARNVPRVVYGNALRKLVDYRRREIRGRAIAALAMLGGSLAREAVLRGLDDPNERVRRLSVELTRIYSDPAVEDALMALREREPELFEPEDEDIVVEVDLSEEDSDEEVMVLEEPV